MVAEREDELGRWKTLGRELGFRNACGSVCAVACTGGPLQLVATDGQRGEELLRLLGAQLAQLYCATTVDLASVVLIVSPRLARHSRAS